MRSSTGLLVATVAAVFTAAATPGAAGAPVFQGLGHTRPEHTRSVPAAVSGDGSVVIGESGDAFNPEFFVWSAAAGMRRFSDISRYTGPARPVDVSDDGSVIVGTVVDPFAGPGRGFRWTQAGGIQTLEPLNTGTAAATSVTAVSADGRIAVGQHIPSGGPVLGVRWAPGGISALDGMSNNNPFTLPTDVSADGTVIVGHGNIDDDPFQHAFRWTPRGGTRRLTEPAGVTSSRPTAASADGSVIVGRMYQGPHILAFRWTESGGMVSLRPPSTAGPARADIASDVSADGRVIIGSGIGQDAFIWDPDNGLRDLHRVLVDQYGLGVQMAGWSNLSPRSISGDGKTIVGVGTNPAGESEVFRAVIPEPAAGVVMVAAAFIALARPPRRRRAVSPFPLPA